MSSSIKFFDPILDYSSSDDENSVTEDDDEKKKMKKKKKVNTTKNMKCVLNVEINGRFVEEEENDDEDDGRKLMIPDFSRIIAIDLFDDDDGIKHEMFTKSMSTIVLEEDDVSDENYVDVRREMDKYWERKTVDSHEQKTMMTNGLKSDLMRLAMKKNGIKGNRELFERLELLFPDTKFALAPVESFKKVMEEDGYDDSISNKYSYDSIVYNACDAESEFKYHIDGDPAISLHRDSPYVKEYGMHSNRDSRKPRFVSLLVYLNDEWDMTWNGETKFLDNNTGIGLCVSPKPGRIVIFDSDILHSASSTTRDAKEARFSLVMKLLALPRRRCRRENDNNKNIDLLRLDRNLGFGSSTALGSASTLRSVVDAFSRASFV